MSLLDLMGYHSGSESDENVDAIEDSVLCEKSVVYIDTDPGVPEISCVCDDSKDKNQLESILVENLKESIHLQYIQEIPKKPSAVPDSEIVKRILQYLQMKHERGFDITEASTV